MKKGDRVLAGQMVAVPGNGLSVGIHASMDGVVQDVTDKYIIFPYDKNGELIDINLSQYSGIKEYLLDNYDLIVPKQISGKSTGRDVPNANENNWYQFGRVQAINEFNNEEKLIVGVMSKEPMFMYDNENLVIQSGGTAGYCGIKMKENNKYDLFFYKHT